MRTTFTGTSRVSGGTFENVVITVNTHDADGFIIRTEAFEPDQEEAALARFDALTAGAAPQQPVRRRVRPPRALRANAATATFAALEAAFARRELAAVDALLGDPLETIEHPTGTTYGREGQLESSRRMMRMPDLDFRIEPLATLGDAFCLARRVVGASGTAGGKFDVGAYEIESIVVNAVDAAGRITVCEVFAPDRLGQAITRLHALYAESLPLGSERQRAEGIARAIAVWGGAIDPQRVLSTTAPSFVHVDHRSLGTWSAVGPDEWVRHWRVQAELAEGFTRRDDDILAFTLGVHVLRHTFSGINRASGGSFENVVLAVIVFDADGRHLRADSYEPDQEAAALACFDALTAETALKPPARRRIRPPRALRANAASAVAGAFDAAFAVQDLDAIAALHAETFEEIDHLTEVTYGSEGVMASLRRTLRGGDPRSRSEFLATLGDRLLLTRRWIATSRTSGGRFDVAESEREWIAIVEVDERGKLQRNEAFAPARLGDAIARLYARHAELLPDGPERVRAAMTARAATTMLTGSTAYRLEDVCTPDLQTVDDRAVGMGTVVGSDLWPRWRAASAELMQDRTYRIEDVLALSADGLLRRTTEMGQVRASGGAFENTIWILSIFGPDGRQRRIELFDLGREAEALARFDALVDGADRTPAPAPPPAPFTNAVGRFLERYADTWATRDWPSQADLYAEHCRFDDRRPLLQMQLPREANLEQLRVLFEVPNGRWTFTPIATRGERLALARLFFEGEVAGGGGALEIDHLGVLEVDGSGRMTAVVLFEPADLDAAYAELDACFEAGDGAMHLPIASRFPRAIVRRDWDAIAAMCGPGFSEHDHRSLAVLGSSLDSESWIGNFRALVDLAPDTVARFEHIRLCPRGSLWQMRWEGSFAGGCSEIPLLGVSEMDGRGKLARIDFYDPEQLDEARARFAEVAAPAPSAEPFANAASATVAPVMAALIAHDWPRFTALLADDFRMSDRRRVVQLELDREQYAAFTREVADGRTVRATSELLATRGERLALTRPVYEFRDADVGPSEIAFLILTEVDARGRIVAYVRWDVEDLTAAYAELDRRWRAVEQVAHPRVVAFHVAFTRALAARDWDGIAALLSPTLAAHDHRLVGWDVRHGPEAYVEVVRAMVDLAPDADGRLDHARARARGFLAEVVWVGTRDGGAFESPFVWVVEIDDAGLATRFDFYDPHHLEKARARFAEIGRNAPQAALGGPSGASGSARDPFAAIAKPNLATVTVERWQAAYDTGFDTGNWDAMRALIAPKYVFEDRRRLALLEGGVDMMMAALRERVAMGARREGTWVGAAGDRVTIFRALWSGGPSDGRFEIEHLVVSEVDETGRFVAQILLDADDPRAARRDAWKRWAAIDPMVAPWTDLIGTAEDGFNGIDLRRVYDIFATDVRVCDHRRTGFGLVEGLDAYLASVRALRELAPDHRLELGWFWPALEPHGVVTSIRRFGALAEGGAFESHYLWLVVAPGGRITHSEYFELEDVDRARARLAELRPDPLRVPPNTATRWRDRWCACGAARDSEGLERLYAPTATFDDRRRLLRVGGDRAMAIQSARHIHESGQVRIERTLLATAGDRLALERYAFNGGKPGADFAIDVLSITEVDANGLALAIVNFDLDDRTAASAELFERYAASGADGASAASLDTVRAWNAHDMKRLRGLLPADFYLDDRRRTGVGRLDGREAYLDSVAALWELSGDVRTETLYSLEIAPNARLYVSRWFGTNAEGGEFDAVYVCVGFVEGNRGGLEIFELDDLDAARARFAALAAVSM